jgi:hypothetical protein
MITLSMPRLRVAVAPARQSSPRTLLTINSAPLVLLMRDGRIIHNPVHVKNAKSGSVYGEEAVAGLVVRIYRAVA